MEITAVIEGLKLLKYECEVEVYSDSAYVVNAFNNHWIEGWIKNERMLLSSVDSLTPRRFSSLGKAQSAEQRLVQKTAMVTKGNLNIRPLHLLRQKGRCRVRI